MPIYAFECAACGHQFDRLQKLSDVDPSHCPVCATGEVRRQLTAPSFRLAGAGWYETDFKKDGDKKRNLVDAGSGAETKSGESKSSESTPPAAKPAEPKPATPAPVAKSAAGE